MDCDSLGSRSQSTPWQSLEEVVLQAAQEVGVPQLSCYTSFKY